jgi:molybdopterin converting factor subunit 1
LQSDRPNSVHAEEIPAQTAGVPVIVLLFARLREIAETPELAVTVRAGARVEELWSDLAARYPALAAERSSTRAARNGEIVTFDSALVDGDEVAFLPPVGGG